MPCVTVRRPWYTKPSFSVATNEETPARAKVESSRRPRVGSARSANLACEARRRAYRERRSVAFSSEGIVRGASSLEIPARGPRGPSLVDHGRVSEWPSMRSLARPWSVSRAAATLERIATSHTNRGARGCSLTPEYRGIR